MDGLDHRYFLFGEFSFCHIEVFVTYGSLNNNTVGVVQVRDVSKLYTLPRSLLIRYSLFVALCVLKHHRRKNHWLTPLLGYLLFPTLLHAPRFLPIAGYSRDRPLTENLVSMIIVSVQPVLSVADRGMHYAASGSVLN
jgi:hypothetical protein